MSAYDQYTPEMWGIYHNGAANFRAGGSFGENPYLRTGGNVMYACWSKGWRDAAANKEEKAREVVVPTTPIRTERRMNLKRKK